MAPVIFLLLSFLHLQTPFFEHLHVSLIPVLPSLPLKSVPVGHVRLHTRCFSKKLSFQTEQIRHIWRLLHNEFEHTYSEFSIKRGRQICRFCPILKCCEV